MLIPDTIVADRGFHDVILLDMVEAVGSAVLMGDLTLLRLQWPLSVVSGKQTDWNCCVTHVNSVFFVGLRGDVARIVAPISNTIWHNM